MTKFVVYLFCILKIIKSSDCKVKVGHHSTNWIEIGSDVNFSVNTVSVTLVDHHIHKRSSSVNHDISLRFRISSEPVILHLEENTQLNNRIPLYTIAVNGSIVQEKLGSDLQNAHYYYDISNGAWFYTQSTGSEKTHMYGTFHHGGDEFIMEYTNNISNIIHKESQPVPKTYNFKVWKTPGNSSHQLHEGIQSNYMRSMPSHRKKRSPSYHVELLFVVDFSVYKHWYDKSKKSSQAEKDADADAKFLIRRLYAFVINGMDGRYRSISPDFMSIVFAGIVISETLQSSPWTETVRNGNNVNVGTALDKFSAWVKTQKDLPSNDHAMLLTRYALANGQSTDLEGFAYVEGICRPESVSIMEESDDYVMMTIAAHELGHSLGSKHDGEGNHCQAADQYIMAPSSTPKLGSFNPWRFSSCSVSYFQRTIQKLDSQKINCLTSFGRSYNPTALNPYSGKLPGQVYTADEQCVQKFGQGSSLCREHYNGDFTPLCGLMWCRSTDNSGACGSMVPADGTLCASQHWCINGVCTFSNSAPSAPDKCAHGDYVGKMDQRGRSCDEIVKLDIKECYRERIELSCCGTCSKAAFGVKGCYYGDRIPSSLCNKTACPGYSKEEVTQCCQTCSAYFTIPGSNSLPTESDGTTEVLIGISVAIVVIAVICGVYVYRRSNFVVRGKRKPGKENYQRPSKPALRKPLTSISTDDTNSKKLISLPILNSHTNTNLKTNFQKPDSKSQIFVNNSNGYLKSNEHKNNQISKPDIAMTTKVDGGATKPAAKTDLHSSNSNKRTMENNTTAQLKNDKSKNFSADKRMLTSPKDHLKTENESVSTIKDRIAVLHHASEKPHEKELTNSSKIESTVLNPVKPTVHKQIKPNAQNNQPSVNSSLKTNDVKPTTSVQTPADKFDKKPVKPPSSIQTSADRLNKKPLKPPPSVETSAKRPLNPPDKHLDKKPLRPPVKPEVSTSVAKTGQNRNKPNINTKKV